MREALFGLWAKRAPGGAGALRDPGGRWADAAPWFARTVLGENGLRVLGLDTPGLATAARLRAKAPLPPSPRRAGQSKPDQRVGWVADIEIAVTAWRWRLPLVTMNRRDFAVLAAALDAIYPDVPPLELQEP